LLCVHFKISESCDVSLMSYRYTSAEYPVNRNVLYMLLQLNIMDWLKCGLVFKVYQTMFRVIKDSENVDERQHCFLIQTSGHESRYLSVETRQELLRIENAWHCSVCAAVMKLGVS
jgi:hypothetical protein